MKNVIIYAVIFIAAFAATTYEVMDLNNKYVNLFKFDFRDKQAFEKMIADSLAQLSADSLLVAQGDSLAVDSLHLGGKRKLVNSKKVAELKDTIANVKTELNTASQMLSSKDKEIEELKNKLQAKQDVQYQDWLKNTIKLYEEMESNKAAQLLQGIPENQARDIIYSMKKKKAAEILSYLETGTVQRLTKAQ